MTAKRRIVPVLANSYVRNESLHSHNKGKRRRHANLTHSNIDVGDTYPHHLPARMSRNNLSMSHQSPIPTHTGFNRISAAETHSVTSENDDEEDNELFSTAICVRRNETIFVLQCANCQSILGDSLHYIHYSPKLMTITLKSAVNITLKKDIKTSHHGLDAGSSYRHFHCYQCRTHLGCVYLTTPQSLDKVRGGYTFLNRAIIRYELGQSNPNRDEASRPTSNALVHASVYPQLSENSENEHDKVVKLQEDMVRVQNLLLVLDERLHQIERKEEERQMNERESDPE